mmetsp:Transcript_86864/g.246093  ORF Transcript_86864/g.246093 Transcript_86864/m.246093 type:complete len:211 (-) Transcript_86864:1150-1782(-)
MPALKVIALALCAANAAAFSFVAPSPVATSRAARSMIRVSMSEEAITDDLMSPPESEGDDLPAPTRSLNPEEECKLFVGNLNFATEDEDLANIFGEFGAVISAEHVADRFDPMRKRGFGFVVFEEKAGAQAAVDALDGNDVDGRTVRVEFFTPKPRTERREQQPRRNFGRGQDGAFHSWPYPKLSLRLKLACVINGPHWRIAPFHTTPGP